jgi:MFS family permease
MFVIDQSNSVPLSLQFLVGVDEVNVGNYVGIVPTAMFVGRFLGSYVWGSIADNIGRKPVVVISILLTGLASGAFGFSVTFEMAVFLRFLVGLFNGIPGTAKAILSESSTNKNQVS